MATCSPEVIVNYVGLFKMALFLSLAADADPAFSIWVNPSRNCTAVIEAYQSAAWMLLALFLFCPVRSCSLAQKNLNNAQSSREQMARFTQYISSTPLKDFGTASAYNATLGLALNFVAICGSTYCMDWACLIIFYDSVHCVNPEMVFSVTSLCVPSNRIY